MTYPCTFCASQFVIFRSEEDLRKHILFSHPGMPEAKKEAIRDNKQIRYDIIDPVFLEMMAKIADYGAKKYGDFNWHISQLQGDKSPINHIYKHLKSLRTNEPYDHKELGEGIEWHLVAIAFNAMMEFYWIMKEKGEFSK